MDRETTLTDGVSRPCMSQPWARRPDAGSSGPCPAPYCSKLGSYAMTWLSSVHGSI